MNADSLEGLLATREPGTQDSKKRKGVPFSTPFSPLTSSLWSLHPLHTALQLQQLVRFQLALAKFALAMTAAAMAATTTAGVSAATRVSTTTAR
jgi:hypothetical protein